MFARVQVVHLLSFTRQPSFNLYENLPHLKLITYCVDALHAVNAPLWQPGEQTQIGQIDRQTNQPTVITRYPLAAARPRVN